MRKKIKKIKLKFAEGELMSIIKQLQTFVDNGGRIQTGVEPKYGEPFYEAYMEQRLKKEFHVGDRVHIKIKYRSQRREEYDCLILNIGYSFEVLISGKQVWKNKRNKKSFPYYCIEDISLIKKAEENFDIKYVDPEDAKWREDIKKNEGRDQFEESIASNQIIRKKKDQKEFNSVYPDVDYNRCHIFKCDYGLYWPFNCEKIEAQITLTVDGENPIFIPCKTGRPYPNKNVYAAYNYKDKEYYDCNIYTYLPDGEYENVNISCVWTIYYRTENTSDLQQKTKIIDLTIIDRLRKIENGRNMYFIEKGRNTTYLGFGKEIFTTDYANLLEGMMDLDGYIVMYPHLDEFVFIKEPQENVDEYILAANLAYYNYDLEAMLASCIDTTEHSITEIQATHYKELNCYFSSSGRKCDERYQWKML